MKRIPILLLLVAFGVHLGPAIAADESEVLLRLKQHLTSNKVLSLRKLEGIELYEVILQGNRVMYTDVEARVLLDGDLYDLESKRNLTEERRDAINLVDFSSLPLEKAIKRVKGDGSRVMAVFADPDCPYCQDLEREIESMSDVTIYLFLYPIEELHPGATARARAVWCSADPAAAWEDWLLREKAPAQPDAACTDPVADIVELGQQLNIPGTPGIAFPSGRLVPGLVPRAQIETFLAEPPRS